MRVEESEVFTSYHTFHEDVWNGDSREDIVCFTTIVTIVCTKLYEFVEVFVPNIKCYCSAALTFTQLVYCNCSIIVQADPRNNATRGVFKAANIGVQCTNFTKVDTKSTTVFRYARELTVYVVNGP